MSYVNRTLALIGGELKHTLTIWIIIFMLFSQLSRAQDGNKFTHIHKIYIADLGREEGADLVREKIRVRLMKSGRFSVVERPESADAVLTGVAGVVRSYDDDGSTSFAGMGVLRLVDLKTDETIWVFEYKRGFGFGSASNRVADKGVEKLLKDATPSAKNTKR